MGEDVGQVLLLAKGYSSCCSRHPHPFIRNPDKRRVDFITVPGVNDLRQYSIQVLYRPTSMTHFAGRGDKQSDPLGPLLYYQNRVGHVWVFQGYEILRIWQNKSGWTLDYSLLFWGWTMVASGALIDPLPSPPLPLVPILHSSWDS